MVRASRSWKSSSIILDWDNCWQSSHFGLTHNKHSHPNHRHHRHAQTAPLMSSLDLPKPALPPALPPPFAVFCPSAATTHSGTCRYCEVIRTNMCRSASYVPLPSLRVRFFILYSHSTIVLSSHLFSLLTSFIVPIYVHSFLFPYDYYYL